MICFSSFRKRCDQAILLLLSSAFSVGMSNAWAQDAAPSVETSPIPSDTVLAAQQQRIEAMRRASSATVAVYGTDGQGGGSGVCISPDGYVLTNFHVSSPFGHRMRCGLNDGRMYDAVVAGSDPTGDLAVLKMVGLHCPRQQLPTKTSTFQVQATIRFGFRADSPRSNAESNGRMRVRNGRISY